MTSDLLQQRMRDGSSARLYIGESDRAGVSAGELLERGAERFGDSGEPRVGLLLTNDLASIEALLGAIEVGANVVSLPGIPRGMDPHLYANRLRALCNQHGIEAIYAASGYCRTLSELGVPARDLEDRSRPLGMSRGQFELVQHTSGSTGDPRGIALTGKMLAANIERVLSVLVPRPGDATVSWLPLSHDMGLVGMLLASIAASGPGMADGGDIVLLDPLRFLRAPAAWLETISRWGATFTAAPDFAYALAARFPPRGPVDLSTLRCAIVGGGVIQPRTLESFTASMAHAGMVSEAMCPAYGMAEVGVAVTMADPSTAWRTKTLVSDRQRSESFTGQLANGPYRRPVVSVGPPLPGVEVVTDTEPSVVGRIRIRTDSIGWDVSSGRSLRDADGWMTTTDLGFVDSGEVFVVGRVDDHIVVNGRNVYCPPIEDELGRLAGVREGRAALVQLEGRELVVVLEEASSAETHSTDVIASARSVVSMQAGTRPDRVVVLPRGEFPLTPSGKLPRFEVARIVKE